MYQPNLTNLNYFRYPVELYHISKNTNLFCKFTTEVVTFYISELFQMFFNIKYQQAGLLSSTLKLKENKNSLKMKFDTWHVGMKYKTILVCNRFHEAA